MTGNSWAPAANAKYEHGAGRLPPHARHDPTARGGGRDPAPSRRRGTAQVPCPKACPSGRPTKRLLAPLIKRRSCGSKESRGRNALAGWRLPCRDPQLPARRRPGAGAELSAPQRLRPTAPGRSQLPTLAPAAKLQQRSVPAVSNFQKGGNGTTSNFLLLLLPFPTGTRIRMRGK